MRFQINYAAAGCLPDSEDYPYVVETDEYTSPKDQARELASVIEEEVELGGREMPYPENDSAFRFAECLTHARAVGNTVAIPMGGTYSLSIERLEDVAPGCDACGDVKPLTWMPDIGASYCSGCVEIDKQVQAAAKALGH